MVKAKPNKQKRARELRRMGRTYRQIKKELNVSLSSVSLWCRDVELTEEQQQIIEHNHRQYGDDNKGAQVNRDTALQQRIAYQQIGREKAREERFLHIIGCMLYWAEGGKYDRNRVDFANSDPVMLDLFMCFLREELDVSDDMIKLKIHCHTDDSDEIQRIEQYWLDLFQSPSCVLLQTRFKKGSKTRHNRLENGVCAIWVNSTEVLMHILGAIQEYGRFTNEDWLT